LILSGYWLSGDGGNEGVFVGSAGGVGIATTTPAQLLHVAGSSQFDASIRIGGNQDITNVSSASRLLLAGGGNGIAEGGAIALRGNNVGDSENGAIRFYTSGVERMSIASTTGAVRIATSAAARLVQEIDSVTLPP
jgi:hypothetical protein